MIHIPSCAQNIIQLNGNDSLLLLYDHNFIFMITRITSYIETILLTVGLSCANLPYGLAMLTLFFGLLMLD